MTTNDADSAPATRASIADARSWEERYRSRTAIWSGEPNSQLVTETSALAPGFALDAGCGEGADAIWLAERGWRVTAADFSSVALARGAAQARKAGETIASRIEWLREDLLQWTPPVAAYDLVSSHFFHLPAEPRGRLFRRLAASVAPGGSLLIVAHHPSDLQTTIKRPPMPELFYTGDDVAAALEADRWHILVNAARKRSAVDPQGRTIDIHDTVFHAQRT